MQALWYAVRPRPVLKYLGELCVVFAALILVPLGVSAACGEFGLTGRYAAVAAGVFVLGAALRRLPHPERVQTNEGMAITALAFLLAPIALTWPTMALPD
jgi:trk system potassium uptake protein TrkH